MISAAQPHRSRRARELRIHILWRVFWVVSVVGLTVLSAEAPAAAAPSSKACERYDLLQRADGQGAEIDPTALVLAAKHCNSGATIDDEAPETETAACRPHSLEAA